MAKVTKEMTISEVLNLDIDSAMVFLESGMHCIGCPASAGESIEEASMVHGINADELVEKLNAYFDSKEE